MVFGERGFDNNINYALFCEQFQEHSKGQRGGQVFFHCMFSRVLQKYFPLSLPSPQLKQKCLIKTSKRH